MKKIKTIIWGFLIIIPFSQTYGQDTLFINNGEELLVNVQRMNKSKVFYKYIPTNASKKMPLLSMKLAYIIDIGWDDNVSDRKSKYANWKENTTKVKIFSLPKKETPTLSTKANHYGRNKNIYMELGGMSLTGALNFDTRFKNTKDGFGFAIGASYAIFNNENHYSFPIQINYLQALKNKPKLYVDYAIGFTMHNYNSLNYMFEVPGGIQFKKVNNIYDYEKLNGFPIISIGFRRVPINSKGLFIKASNSFIFSQYGMYFIYPSLSFGLSLPSKRKK